MKKLVEDKAKLLVSLLIVIVLILSLGLFKKNHNSKILTIGGKIEVGVKVARKPAELAQGYSNHSPISDHEGMLFIMPNTALHTFWMKNMLFDLDFIYINNNKVVDLIENVPCPANYNGQTYIVNPQKAFNKVLEVKSGFVKNNKIKVGDLIELKEKTS